MHAFRILGVICLLSLATPQEAGAALTHPAADARFLILPDGRDLRQVNVNGAPLRLARGAGNSFGPEQEAAYLRLKSATQNTAGHLVQWALMDLDTGRVIAESRSSEMKQFGASVSKIFVAGTLLDRLSGTISASQLQLMSDMIVVSSNTAWTNLQNQIGGGDSNRGRERIHGFTQRMGYERTVAFQGYWGDMHGNELTARELVEYLRDMYRERFAGAAAIWKVMHTLRTGAGRAHKYLPESLYVGGKTGTYDGETVDPETGSSTFPDGSPYTVRVRHQVVVFHAGGKEYGLSLLANNGSDESAALLAGGLYREYIATSGEEAALPTENDAWSQDPRDEAQQHIEEPSLP